MYLVRFRIPSHLRAQVGMIELSRSLLTSDPTVAKSRCLRATTWFRETMGKISKLSNPTRADLERAAVQFFGELERELDQKRDFDPENIADELAFNREESLRRVAELDQQLIMNAFDKKVQAAAEMLLDGSGVENIQPAMGLVAEQLAARAERQQLLKLLHLLSTPVQAFAPDDPLFEHRPRTAEERASNQLPSTLPTRATLREAAEAFIDKVRASGRGTSHQNELARALRWLEECIEPERPIAAITKAELRAFRNDIERIGANQQGKSLSFKARLVPPSQARIRSVTAKRYWQSVKSFFAWVEAEGYIHENPAASLRIDSKKGEERRSPQPFSALELRALFASPLYGGHLSRHRLSEPGDCRARDGFWWSGVLLLYTGLRAGEFAQLLPSDFVFDAEIPHLKVQMEDASGAKVKSAKTASSIRDVPIHPDLLRLGLRELVVRRAKLKPGKRTFHEFRFGADGRKSDGMTKFWSTYLKRFDLWKPGRSTHVFRHTFAACLRAADVAEVEIGALLGHSPQTVTGGYGGALPLTRKLKALQSLDFGFDVVGGLGGEFADAHHRA